MTTDCTYCGSDVTRHTPVYVEEVVGGERTQTGQFCNYACLSMHIADAELTTGASCELDLG